MGHEKVARLPFCTCPCYCINFCIYDMLRTRATFAGQFLPDRHSMQSPTQSDIQGVSRL